MRFVVVLAALALLAGCGEDAQPMAPRLADLTVTVDHGSKTKRAAVRCAAAEDSDVCRAVAALKAEAFEPTPGHVACTEIYGGPETATITGTLRGEPIDARFSRENGCEIARWLTARPLLDAAG
jgi:hypothetical protein